MKKLQEFPMFIKEKYFCKSFPTFPELSDLLLDCEYLTVARM
jgi:hypothetical protein